MLATLIALILATTAPAQAPCDPCHPILTAKIRAQLAGTPSTRATLTPEIRRLVVERIRPS